MTRNSEYRHVSQCPTQSPRRVEPPSGGYSEYLHAWKPGAWKQGVEPGRSLISQEHPGLNRPRSDLSFKSRRQWQSSLSSRIRSQARVARRRPGSVRPVSSHADPGQVSKRRLRLESTWLRFRRPQRRAGPPGRRRPGGRALAASTWWG
eukprot:759595-Hanusia_phi.AAC.1